MSNYLIKDRGWCECPFNNGSIFSRDEEFVYCTDCYKPRFPYYSRDEVWDEITKLRSELKETCTFITKSSKNLLSPHPSNPKIRKAYRILERLENNGQ